MRCVRDASVALKWVLNEPDAAKARQLRDDFRNDVHELIPRDSFTLAIAHALTKAQRRRLVPDAWRLRLDVMTTVPHLFPSLPLTPRAIQIATKARIGLYNCLNVAVTEREGCEMVTTDARLLTNLQPSYAFIISLAFLP
jgi:predicted nucleic acid-binding protein